MSCGRIQPAYGESRAVPGPWTAGRNQVWAETGKRMVALLMTNRRMADDAAWPHVLHDLRRLGATPGAVLRIAEMVDVGLHEVAFSLLEDTLQKLRDDQYDCV